MPVDLKAHIRPIPDFPKPGILFYDITTLLLHGEALKDSINRLVTAVRPYKPDLLAGIESRGFIFGAPVAYALGCGFTVLRKKGKLPGNTTAHEYALEYGTDTLEMHDDAVHPGQRVVLIDDLLATGGTLEVPAAACVIELSFLGGRGKLDIPVETLVTYES
jgi:adenine phosphoribosyltransferase